MAMIPSPLLLWFLLSLFVILRSKADDQLSFVDHKCNDFLGNFTPGSTYEKNRNTLLYNIYSDTEIDYGFYNFSYGQDSDKVNAVGLCRGDVKPDVCRTCLEKSAPLLTERCKVQKAAIGWFDQCMLRYSNESIFGVMVTGPSNIQCSSDVKSTMGDKLQQTLDDLLNRLGNITVSGDSRRKFAEADSTVHSTNETVYALLQCTPDLSEQNCTDCLSFASSQISFFCRGKRGSKYLGPSCSARYENYTFFEPIVVVDAPAPQPETSPSQLQLVPPPGSAITTPKPGTFHVIYRYL